jgi:hypothetical protein
MKPGRMRMGLLQLLRYTQKGILHFTNVSEASYQSGLADFQDYMAYLRTLSLTQLTNKIHKTGKVTTPEYTVEDNKAYEPSTNRELPWPNGIDRDPKHGQ